MAKLSVQEFVDYDMPERLPRDKPAM